MDSTKQRICLICPNAPKESWGDLYSSSADQKALKKAVKKIFQYLLISSSKAKAITNVVSFCPDCLTVVQEIIRLQKKMEALEMTIQFKVETLGRVVLGTPIESLIGKGKSGRDIWKKFRQPVIKYFLKGYLPSPSVCLKSKSKVSQNENAQTRTDTIEPASHIIRRTLSLQPRSTTIELENYKNNDQLANGKKKSSKPYLIEDDRLDVDLIKEEAEDVEDVDLIKEEAEDVEDVDLEEAKDVEDVDLEEAEDVEDVDLEEAEDLEDEINSEFDSFLDDSDDNLFTEVTAAQKENLVDEITQPNEGSHNNIVTSNGEINNEIKKNRKKKKSKTLNNTDDDDYDDEQLGFQVPVTSRHEDADQTKKPGISSKMFTNTQLHNEKGRKRIRPTQGSAPKRFKYSSDEDYVTEESVSDSDDDFEIDSDLELESELDSSNSLKSSLDVQEISLPESKDDNVANYNNQQQVNKRKKKRKKVLTKSKDKPAEPKIYTAKCPQCDFVASYDGTRSKPQWNCQRYVRSRLITHFTECHNPVDYNDVSKSKCGKDFYKCCLCNFRATFTSEEAKRFRAHRCLSLHYIRIHDNCKIKNNSSAKLINLTEGKDYLKCPEQTCQFYTMISRTARTKALGRKGARVILIKHYNIAHDDLGCISYINGNKCYKCSKCEYISFVNENSDSSANRYAARKLLYRHYNSTHHPPNFFDNTYQADQCKVEQIGEDSVVKCPKCDYLTKIKEIKGKSAEECYFAAKHSFLSHFGACHSKYGSPKKNKLPILKQSAIFSEPRITSNTVQKSQEEIGGAETTPHAKTKKRRLKKSTRITQSDSYQYEDVLPEVDFQQPVSKDLENKNVDCTALERSESLNSEGAEDYYRCWKCDFAVKVNYTERTRPSQCQFFARHKLEVHFHAAHNYKELHFGNPEALIVTIDDEQCLKCPKCEFVVKVKFDPIKHRTPSQSRRSARQNTVENSDVPPSPATHVENNLLSY